MTETDTTTRPANRADELPEGVDVVVPEGSDPLDDLHVVELAAMSRKLGCDVVEAVQLDRDGKRWDALLQVALAWAKRSNPQASLDPFKRLKGDQLLIVLGDPLAEDDESEDDDPAANPTESARES